MTRFPMSHKKLTNIHSRASKMIEESFHSRILQHRLSLASKHALHKCPFLQPYIIIRIQQQLISILNAILMPRCHLFPQLLSNSKQAIVAVPSSFMLNLRVRVGLSISELSAAPPDWRRCLPSITRVPEKESQQIKSSQVSSFAAVQRCSKTH